MGELPTCDTAGVLGPAAGAIASLESVAAIKLLSGNEAALGGDLLVFDFWGNRYRSVSLAAARREECRCCGERQFDFLDEPAAVGKAYTVEAIRGAKRTEEIIK